MSKSSFSFKFCGPRCLAEYPFKQLSFINGQKTINARVDQSVKFSQAEFLSQSFPFGQPSLFGLFNFYYLAKFRFIKDLSRPEIKINLFTRPKG